MKNALKKLSKELWANFLESMVLMDKYKLYLR
ncbi:MAG: hypothetical protein K0S04_1061 [Herbinix sp.]|jgi:hypothetical protein|nr:hypothetical protein [Herbinix sp.]